MPERFNFGSLSEIADDRPVRSALLRHIGEIFSNWLREPTKVFLQGIDDQGCDYYEQASWVDANSILNRRLSDGEILAIHFSGVDVGEFSSISIMRNSVVTTCSVSLPDTRIANSPSTVLDLLVATYFMISSLGISSVVAAGAEFEVDEDSVDAMIASASSLDSLADYLCCNASDVVKVDRFVLVEERDGAALLRRMRTAARSQ